MVKHLISFISTFLSISVVVYGIVMVYLIQIDLEMNEKIGKGLFYLKGYYQDGNEIVTEQGIGVVTIPLMVGLVISILYKIFQYILRSKAKTN